MLKKKLKNRYFSLYYILMISFFIFLLVANYFKVSVFAANVSGLTVDGLTASYENGTWTSSGTGLNGSATGSAAGRCSDASATTSTLTFKNTKGSTAKLKFDYAKPTLGSGGSVKIDGTAVTTAGSFEKDLANNATITIVIVSGSPGNYTSSIVITNIQLVIDRQVTITFNLGVIAETNNSGGGSVKVNGDQISLPYTNTQASTISYTLVATASSGYKFMGWKSSTSKGFISQSTTFESMFEDDQTITPYFKSTSNPTFEVDTEWFPKLDTALAYAINNNKPKIVLIDNGTIPAGTYTIPNGKTLLLPFDDAHTTYTTTPAVVYGSHTTPSAYKTLTMASGANIKISNGAILSIPSKLSATGTGSGSWNGTPTGKYGKIQMNSGSSIEIQSGGKLYCYGYIAGSGTVTAKSGSEVWEAMQFRCWRGGTASSGMTSGVFPMNQYYIQNIEVPLTIYYGATEKVYTSINMNSRAYPTSTTFIGPDGMFILNNGKVTKRYDGATDRLIFSVEGESIPSENTDPVGDMIISSISLTMAGAITIESNEYQALPITNNITIEAISGIITISESQSLAMLPGSELNIHEGCQLNIKSNVYLYDKDEWFGKSYAAPNNDIVVVGYSTVNGTTAKRNADGSNGLIGLTDAKIDMNGELLINGQLYTTSSGANITSSNGTGYIKFLTDTTSSPLHQQATQSNTSITRVEIQCTPAKLHNGENPTSGSEYTLTTGAVAGTVYYFCMKDHQWETGSYKITFNGNGATSGYMAPQYVCASGNSINLNEFAKEHYLFSNWCTNANGTGGDSYTDGQNIILTSDITLYAQWEIEKFTVTFSIDNQHNWGTINITSISNVEYGSPVTRDINNNTITIKNQTLIPTPLEDDENYIYSFLSFQNVPNTITSNVTIIILFDRVFNDAEYTITWIIDGVSSTTQVVKNQIPQHEDPTKNSDNIYDYIFDKWDPEIVPATDHATYTAQFDSTPRIYNITYSLDGGSSSNVTTYTYFTETFNLSDPIKTGYTFTGWTGSNLSEITNVVTILQHSYGDLSFTAHYSINSYLITFKNQQEEVLFESYFEYNTAPEYGGDDLSDINDSNTSVDRFSGWNSEKNATEPLSQLPLVVEDKVYYAIYVTLPKFAIIFDSNGGTNIATQYVIIGEKVIRPSNPIKDGHTFINWQKNNVVYDFDMAVSQSFTLVASWNVLKYTITFNNIDGYGTISHNSISNVPYNSTVTINNNTITINGTTVAATPIDSTAQFEYVFVNWSNVPEKITGDETITANFSRNIRKYLIRFINGENVLQSSEVEYGATPTYTGEIPTKVSTEVYSYTFNGWSPTIYSVDKAQDYIAQFSQTAIIYHITLVYESETLSDIAYNLVDGFNLPNKDYSGFEGEHTSYFIKKWENGNEKKNVGYSLTATDSGKTFTAFTGGFYHESSNIYYIEPTRQTFNDGLIKGLYKIKTEDGNNLKIHYFDETYGILQNDNSIYTFNGDSNKYVIEGGFVKSNEGLAKSNNDYYYVTDKNYLIKSGRHYLTEFNGNLNFKEGYYNFSDSFIDRDNVDNDADKFDKIYIDNDSLYYDGILLPYGLYQASDNKYYYAMHNGTLLDNKSIYIVSSKANGYATYQNIVCKFNNKKMYNPFTGSDV